MAGITSWPDLLITTICTAWSSSHCARFDGLTEDICVLWITLGDNLATSRRLYVLLTQIVRMFGLSGLLLFVLEITVFL